jgi:excisionase family DNA binding protein
MPSDDPGPHLDDLDDLPPTVGVETAARILGCGRTLAYQLLRRGEFPCRVLRLGRRYLIPTHELRRVLGVPDPHPPSRDRQHVETKP